ncbi:MAG: hypothetical protein LLG20_20615 [Acidobacteriales bacterium]|nr:hypothetical protein [Terriglobales bacterium]
MSNRLLTFFLIGSLCLLAQPQSSVRITAPVDGDILNRHDGAAVNAGLKITVKGSCTGAKAVKINGKSVAVRDGSFEAPVVLRQWENRIAVTAGGARTQELVYWDRDSKPRYRFSIDDNIWFLRNIARNADRYKSIFENPYMAFWKSMHDKYGAKIHFNLFYETDGFNLSQMPDKFKPEWQANRDWIRLTFHARAEFPDKPYIKASGEQIDADYRLVTREIERFAGRELLSATTTVHWGEATLDGVRALRAEGITVLAGYFMFQKEVPMVSYYLDTPRIKHLMGRDYWKDTKEDVIFARHDLVVNTLPLDQIVPHLEKVAADPHQAELMELMIHEQYFYPDYRNYQPDFRQKVERTIEWATKKGYKSTLCDFGEESCAPPVKK